MIKTIKLYADYRSSQAGGSYNTFIATAEDINDQFGYGIPRHCIANKNFAFYTQKIWDLEFWYSLGKGLQYSAIRWSNNNSDLFRENYHVPTFGAPGSDVLMLSNLDKAYSIYNVGRVAVVSEEEVLDYLSKVILHDNKDAWDQNYESRYWMKKILHLSGGNPEEQEILFNALEDMRYEIEGNKFGADVTTLRKFNSTTIDESFAELATNLINEGVSIITFFGHSSAGAFDFSLEDPSQYDNQGKFPFIISLGCYSGNIHTPTDGLSENFVLEPEKGAIAFLASVGPAYIHTQAAAGPELYKYFGEDYYTKTYSEAIRNLNLNFINSTTIDYVSLMQQITYHGDPALRFFDAEGVDLTINKNSIKTIPAIVDPTLTSFSFECEIANLGSTIDDSISVRLDHFGPDANLIQSSNQRIKSPFNKETVSFNLSVPDVGILGKNTINVVVDELDEIAELPLPEAENNNELTSITDGEGYCMFVLDNGIRGIYPSEFSIINDECPFELKASTNNAFLSQEKYVFQIDTTELFNSPLLDVGEVLSNGGMLTWVPNIQKQANSTYYWRVGIDTTGTNKPFAWDTKSFTYLPNESTGWNQGHYFQFLKNEQTTLYLEDNRDWEYRANIKSIRFDVGLDATNGEWVWIDGSPWASLNQENQGNLVGVFVFDPFEIIYFNNADHPYSEFPTAGTNFIYKLKTPESRKLLMDLLDNIPDRSRAFVYTIIKNDPYDWKIEDWEDDTALYGYNLFDKFEENGFENIESLKTLGNVPFVLAFEKGGEVIAEDYGEDKDDEIKKTYTAFWKLKEGTAKTVEIGPVTSWESLSWSYHNKEDHDTIFLNVYGIDQMGNELLVYEQVESLNIDLADLNELGVKYCKLEVYSSDNFGPDLSESNRTSPQIDYLRVNYTGVPDLALITDEDYIFEADTLLQGKPLVMEFPIENYTPYDIGETEMKVLLKDEANNDIIDTVKIEAVQAKGRTFFKWTYDTKDLAGDYIMNLLLNEGKNPAEIEYFNNFGLLDFHVTEDKINPVLDVTFDGLHISNGDVVSASPTILICGTDENPYLAMDDPNYFTITLEHPNATEPELIDMLGDNIEFNHTSQDNKASIIFTPGLLPDGVYKLNVEAKDASENDSGQNDFCISFEVINRKAVSNVFNYPNPFSTSTQFVFNVTGDVAPQMMINIYTLSGKLVKQILPEELGLLRVGLNRTEYKWDGTDAYGEKLANGTYLYKVVKEDSFEHLETSRDEYFNDGFGKLVIMR